MNVDEKRIKITYKDGLYKVNVPNWDGGEVVMASQLDAALAEGARLRSYFSQYGEHLAKCSWMKNHANKCTCGFVDALSLSTTPLSASYAERYEAMRAFVDSVAGLDCDQYDKVLNPKPCGECISCLARALGAKGPTT